MTVHEKAAMENAQADVLSPVDASIDAALELEELRQGLREDAPSLSRFFEILREPAPAFAGNGVRMLADVQKYYLRHSDKAASSSKSVKIAPQELKLLVERFLNELEQGVRAGHQKQIEEAKSLCLSINRRLLARKMDDIFSRKRKRGFSIHRS